MNTRAVARDLRQRLAAAGVPDPEFEAEYLVREATGLSRAQFFAAPDLAPLEFERIEALALRRCSREPSAYLVGRREFYGLQFAVSRGVLVPRPETEILVDIARAEADAFPAPVVLEVGTGSGAVAIATALSLRNTRARVVATEISPDALAVAVHNRNQLGAPVDVVQSDLARSIGRADIILANLPYIPSDEIDALEPEVSAWEPRVALDGGRDGFTLIRALVADCAQRLRPSVLALEIGYGMATTAVEICCTAGAATDVRKDFAGIDRIVVARWR